MRMFCIYNNVYMSLLCTCTVFFSSVIHGDVKGASYTLKGEGRDLDEYGSK
jgi:hypothetical protein